MSDPVESNCEAEAGSSPVTCSVSDVLDRLETWKKEIEVAHTGNKRLADQAINKHDAKGWEMAIEMDEMDIQTLTLAIETIQRLNTQEVAGEALPPSDGSAPRISE